MNLFRNLLFIIFVYFFNSCISNSPKIESKRLDIVFEEGTNNFTEFEKKLAINILTDSEKEVRILLPNLPKDIKVNIEVVDWNIDKVGGVTGRAESNSPPQIIIQISNKFPVGIATAVNAGLRSTIFHEFHHLSLG